MEAAARAGQDPFQLREYRGKDRGACLPSQEEGRLLHRPHLLPREGGEEVRRCGLERHFGRVVHDARLALGFMASKNAGPSTPSRKYRMPSSALPGPEGPLRGSQASFMNDARSGAPPGISGSQGNSGGSPRARHPDQLGLMHGKVQRDVAAEGGGNDVHRLPRQPADQLREVGGVPGGRVVASRIGCRIGKVTAAAVPDGPVVPREGSLPRCHVR